MKKIATIAGLAVLALAAAAVAGVGRPDNAHGTSAPAKGDITVSATGTVTRAPDQADLDFGVVSRAETAKEALSENSAAARRVIDALKHAGVDGKDIRTDDVSLNPTYDDNGQAITGYQAHNSVHVTSKIGDSGDLIDTGASAGANEINGPALSIADQDALYNEALKKAVETARTKAEAIAGAAGVHVGNVTSVHENTGYEQPQPMYRMAAASMDMKAPVEAGTQDIQAHVTVTFAIG